MIHSAAIHALAEGDRANLIPWLVGALVGYLVVMAFTLWKVFAKAGRPGWACWIPVYNLIVVLQLAGRPRWWLLLYALPVANLIVAFIVGIGVANAFGKSSGFGVGLAVLGIVFYPILGFGGAVYRHAPR